MTQSRPKLSISDDILNPMHFPSIHRGPSLIVKHSKCLVVFIQKPKLV